jgi:hypothetical protein
MSEPSADNIDWSLTTWEGARREQLRRWAELPLERMILALEEMQDLAETLSAPPERPGQLSIWAGFSMRMTPIDSSAIARAGYDVPRKILRLEYRNGRIYDYSKVPPPIYKRLLSADSAGEFVNLEIKPNYDCSEVG